MSKYLDPKSDIVFRKIFGEHPHLLISFLNAVLPLPLDKPIIAIDYLPNEHIPEIPGFKHTIADVKCKDMSGRTFIVEMQINWTDSFKQRLLFGTSQALVKQLEKGQMYRLLEPVYGLGLVADSFDIEQPEWYHHYQLVKQGSPNPSIIEHLQLIFIELPKFPIVSQEDKKLRILWLRFLREIDEKTTSISEDLLNIPEISEAIILAEQTAYTEGELNAYQSYWDGVRREKTLIADTFYKGKAEGLVEGKAEGFAIGQYEEKCYMAKKLYIKGFSIVEVAELTGLSITDLEIILK